MGEETNSYKILKGKVEFTLKIMICQNICLKLLTRVQFRVFSVALQLEWIRLLLASASLSEVWVRGQRWRCLPGSTHPFCLSEIPRTIWQTVNLCGSAHLGSEVDFCLVSDSLLCTFVTGAIHAGERLPGTWTTVCQLVIPTSEKHIFNI